MSATESLGPDAERNFARSLRVIRETMGLSQGDLARLITEQGVSMVQQTVARLETGKRSLRLDEAVAFAWALKMPLQGMDEVGQEIMEVTMELGRLEEELARQSEQLQHLRSQTLFVEMARERLLRQQARLKVRADALGAF
jgi:transcriptional regulator with XRE-family HTH domain